MDDLKSIESEICEIDIFISTAVFQHFPSKAYGVDVLSIVSKKMKKGGIGIVQIRYDDGTVKFRPKELAEYQKRYIYATSYKLVEFWEILKVVGLNPLAVVDVDKSINYATFVFEKN